MKFHEKVRGLYLEADWNCRYWRLLERRYRRLDRWARFILAAGALGSVILWVSQPNSEWIEMVAVIAAGVSALLATIVLPSLNWNNLLPDVVEVKAQWVDIRNDYESVFFDLVNGKDESEIRQTFDRVNAIDQAAEKASAQLPQLEGLMAEARQEVIAVNDLKG